MIKLHVSEEANWLHDFVDDSLDRFRRKATQAAAKKSRGRESGEEHPDDGTGGADTQFMCAHIRRQDFEASCARYEEEYRTGRWVDRYSTFMRCGAVTTGTGPSEMGFAAPAELCRPRLRRRIASLFLDVLWIRYMRFPGSFCSCASLALRFTYSYAPKSVHTQREGLGE